MRLRQLELTEKELTIGQDSKDFWGSTNLVKSVYKYNKALNPWYVRKTQGSILRYDVKIVKITW